MNSWLLIEVCCGGVPVKRKKCYYTNQKCYYKKGGSNNKGNNFRKSKSKLETNTVDSDENIIRSHDCDSKKYCASNCPHRKVEETNRTVHITLCYFSNRKSWFWESAG